MGMSLEGRRALVSGGTRGIGRAIAERLAAEGANVFVTGRTSADDLPAGCNFIAADFANPDEIEKLVSTVGELALDVLINNAGINRLASFAQIKTDEFDLIQAVNVRVPFRLCQAALPAMTARNWGRIVNICSVWGKIGKEFRASYSTSKFGLAGMTAALAAEVARHGILANCVSPGPIDTEMTSANLTAEMRAELMHAIPMGRLGRAEEVASFVFWLCSPENTFVTGQNIAIDGGLTRV